MDHFMFIQQHAAGVALKLRGELQHVSVTRVMHGQGLT